MTTHIPFSLQVPLLAQADVVVAGGGPAGVGAALAAARYGASVLLIEQRGYLGGMATVSLVPAYCPFSDKRKAVIRGIGMEILEELKSRMEPRLQEEWRERIDWVPIQVENLKKIMDEKMEEAGVSLLYHTFVSNVIKKEDRVEAIIIHNKSGTFAVKANFFIDATSDADIAFLAGGAFHKGGENGELQPATMCFVLTKLDRKAFMQYQDVHGSLDQAVMRAKQSGELKVLHNWALYAFHDDHTAGFNFGHVAGIDGTNAADLTRGAIAGRALVHHIVGWLRSAIPGFENAMIMQTGEQIGIRETRRIVGDCTVTIEDFMACRSFPDDISRNAYFIDVHLTQPLSDGKTYIDSVHLPPGQSHGIPYRALLPAGLANILVAGRSISTDRRTQGSARVMPNCFAIGEAAGTAAAILSGQGLRNTREIEMETLQRTLVKQGAWLGEAVNAKYGGDGAAYVSGG